ncbi:hypothetical protein KMT30_13935 [Streptomyces sp. IBSBF 2953]|uniref:hypothetical protein n=1 Tax=Streptomyces TaxID=1883 RepID=UPI00211A2461|nr:hypothetical protein [Streptomyces scabiei]MCQ9180106.1 hypothetical protein [Streptomyces hayashii]MDX3112190.1 hypothetical protein [Streptomyces scabiei]
MFGRIRTAYGRLLDVTRTSSRPHGPAGPGGTPNSAGRRAPNLFEAAAAYVSACAENDQGRIDEAAGWVSPEALSFGVNELACRAVLALARERDQSPQAVARALLGLPTR